MRSRSCYAENNPAPPKVSKIPDGSAPRVIAKNGVNERVVRLGNSGELSVVGKKIRWRNALKQ